MEDLISYRDGFFIAVGAAAVLLLFVILLLIRRRGRPAGTPEESLVTISRGLERIADLEREVSTLSSIFLVPHARGGIGQTMLEELLKSWLPSGSYALQYQFRDGKKADAVIFLGNHKVVVDAKFPLESFKRALEEGTIGNGSVPADLRQALNKHAEDIGSKYIQPEEGTLQFALMYIPSERIYYHAFVEPGGDLSEMAVRKGVLPVGPSGLFIYLQTIAYGLRGVLYPERQREILALLHGVNRELDKHLKTLKNGEGHLRNFNRSFDASMRCAEELKTTLDRIMETGPESRHEI